MLCKICNSTADSLFKTKILNKYVVDYYQCANCEFIQTENPFWIKEAYENVITSLDIGLIYRNNKLANFLAPLLHKYFRDSNKFIDYGGGYGMFVRLMRDKGLDFYRQDIYCENLFANYFDISDLDVGIDFTLLTAFEVFEHLVDPIDEIGKMFDLAPSILFSTSLQPNQSFVDSSSWWYFTPETGQHISLYTKRSLQIIADKFNKQIISNGSDLHLFTEIKLPKNVLKKSIARKVINRLLSNNSTQKSLLLVDYNKIKKALKSI